MLPIPRLDTRVSDRQTVGRPERKTDRSPRRRQHNQGRKPMTYTPAGACCLVIYAALCGGCATSPTLAPFPANGSELIDQHAAEVLIEGVRHTRASGREVAGFCWNDKTTDTLAYTQRSGAGDDLGVGVALSTDTRGRHYVSCTWHTHPWTADAVPGPSRQDLRNSMLPWTSGMSHFVIDQQGIWRYADGKVIAMCPWNSLGTNFEPRGCRTGFGGPNIAEVRVSRYYGRRD
jgi:hypothetical protein